MDQLGPDDDEVGFYVSRTSENAVALGRGPGGTYVDDGLELAQDLGERGADEGKEVGHEAGFADEDVEEGLVDFDKLDKLGERIGRGLDW